MSSIYTIHSRAAYFLSSALCLLLFHGLRDGNDADIQASSIILTLCYLHFIVLFKLLNHHKLREDTNLRIVLFIQE